MIVKLRIKKTKGKDYKTLPKEFKNEEAFNKWYDNQILDESVYKILDFEIIK